MAKKRSRCNVKEIVDLMVLNAEQSKEDTFSFWIGDINKENMESIIKKAREEGICIKVDTIKITDEKYISVECKRASDFEKIREKTRQENGYYSREDTEWTEDSQ